MSNTTRDVIDALLRDIFDQVPTMRVKEITLTPEIPNEGDAVIAKIDVSNNRYVYCEIGGDGSLHSARVVDLNTDEDELA
jgi:hypothetical protein